MNLEPNSIRFIEMKLYSGNRSRVLVKKVKKKNEIKRKNDKINYTGNNELRTGVTD